MKTFKIRGQNENTPKVKGSKVDFSLNVKMKIKEARECFFLQ